MDLQDSITRDVTQYLVTHFGEDYNRPGSNRTEFTEYESMYLQRLVATLTVTRILATATSVIACVFAFISWTVLPKWRTFKNFIYLNLILSYTMTYILPFATLLRIPGEFYSILSCLIWCSYLCWFLTASINTYLDIVKVFSLHVSGKKTKCFICVWSASALNTAIVYMAGKSEYISVKYIMYICTFASQLTIVLNCFIYARVLHSLFYVTRTMNKEEYKRKVQVATFTFLMSGCMMFPVFLAQMLFMFDLDKLDYSFYAGCSVIAVNVWTIVINFCFVMLKPNRMLWRQACCKGSNNNSFV